MRPRTPQRPLPLLVLSILSTLALFATPPAFAGGAGVGGGDECGERFDHVAKDIGDWITAGGPASLDYDNGDGVTPSTYTTRMRDRLKNYNVTCIKPGESVCPEGKTGNDCIHLPLMVDGKPKECVNYQEKGKTQVVCDRQKFYSDRKQPDNDEGQYKIVHHELASAAGLEPHVGAKSTYYYSEQLSAYVTKKEVFYLSPIKPKPQNVDIRLTKIERGGPRFVQGRDCPEQHQTITGKDETGKLRLSITKEVCTNRPENKQARTYILTLYSSDGTAVESHAFGLPDNMLGRGLEAEKDGAKLERLFNHLQGDNCQIITVSPFGGLVDHSSCRFTSLPQDDNEAPAAGVTSGVAT